MSLIKSIQRGVVENEPIYGNMDITINAVNITKSVVITSGDGVFYSETPTGTQYIFFKHGYLLDGTTLRLKNIALRDVSWTDIKQRACSWQVIEYN